MVVEKGGTRDAIVRCAKCGGETTPGTRKCIKCGRNLLPVFLALVGTINIIGAAIAFPLLFMMGLTHPGFLLGSLFSLFGVVLNYNLVRGRYWAWLATVVLSSVFGILGIAAIAASIIFQDAEVLVQAMVWSLGIGIWATYLYGKNVRAFCSAGKNAKTAVITLFVTTVVIIIGVVLGSRMFIETGKVSWAEVLERVAKVKAVRYRMVIDMTGMEGLPEGKEIHLEMEALLSAELGMALNSYVDGTLISQTFAQIEEQAMISLMPAQKKYVRVLFTEEIFEKMREENRDPKKMVDGFLTGEYTELGRSEIDGVVIEGVESTDKDLAQGMLGNAVGRLWVDVETGWPVQITIDVVGADGEVQMELVMDGFEWDVEVDASEFAAEIPEDYELMAEVDLGQLESGVQIADGLGFFAEVADGKYPSDLAMMTVNQELSKAMAAKTASGTREDPSKKDIQRAIGLQMTGAFFGGMANEGKDPAYYGDTVTAADVDKVLLRWKLDDGQYRVIYGDLRIEDVSAEKLAELEAE